MKPTPFLVLSVILVATESLSGQTLSSSVPKLGKDSVRIRVFADGAIRALVGGQGSGSTATAGSIGVSIVDSETQFSTQISVATANDTLHDGFGASVLAPASGGRLAAGLADYRRRHFWKGWGLHAYASASSARWLTLNPQDAKESIAVGAAGLGASLFRTIINQAVSDNNEVAILLDLGIAYRGLFGDIANADFNAVKLRTLGTIAEHFVGTEIGLTIQVNDVRAGMEFYYFHTHAPGLRDGQLVAGFSLQGGLFSWLTKWVR